ncbi:MAG: hypothetical protein HN995_12095 [Candidatus Marinimicrobia bacterium]|jgi:hypothetical protein|nr:hypothetical protein [Candidatus Neomarinimicrobiota bacterium]MBT3576545.1 hypothetical protein [Candidatus Neomarinimicrobiota bacterium]MBT3680105.1 hypothetical protein [Candidatus Neomarinimicrobiota bacterium]MBT3951312.1 hypothetical protein [Candidatus Neomarinimicrobiota bacterium]MBT4253057.1 hypothetical protein [Candidatus Neomarinimicrobiota bacterium]
MSINIRRTYNHTDSQDVLIEKLKRKQGGHENPFTLQIASHLISVSIKADELHWWSPEMALRLETEENKTIVFETIGPNPSMFTFSMFFVILGSVGFLASLMWALSLMAVGESSIIAWILNFVSGSLIVSIFGILALGRIKAADQVANLRQFMSEMIGT